jgi:hypothetical protein
LITSGIVDKAERANIVLNVKYQEEENYEEKERRILICLGQRAMTHRGKLSMLVPG